MVEKLGMYGTIPLELLVGFVVETHQTLHDIGIALGCSLELDGKAPMVVRMKKSSYYILSALLFHFI